MSHRLIILFPRFLNNQQRVSNLTQMHVVNWTLKLETNEQKVESYFMAQYCCCKPEKITEP